MRKILILPLIIGLGAVMQNHYTPYILVLCMVAVVVLVLSNKVKERDYPFVIYALALAMIWQTSMIGTYIVGVDIHSEYYATNKVIDNGWNPATPDGNNTSIVMAFITPALSKVIPVVWQFKLLFPMVFAFTPVILFFVYRTIVDNKKALLASMFIISLPMFGIETSSMVKSLVAETFLALVLLCIAVKFKGRLIVGAFAIAGAVLSHYTVGMITIGYVVVSAGILCFLWLISRWTKVKVNLGVLVLVGGVLIAFVGWYGTIANGAMLKTVLAVKNNISQVAVDTITQSNTPLVDKYLERTQFDASPATSYFQNQEPLVRAALGLDFFDVDWKGKIFRVLQLMTEILLAIGGLFLLKYWKRNVYYTALAVTGVLLLAACVFVPYFTTTVSATRYYQVALFVTAPLLVIGASEIVKRSKVLTGVALSLFGVYYMFTSGVVFETTKTEMSFQFSIPYSVALSNYRANVMGVFNDDDIAAVKFVRDYDKTLPVFTGYQGSVLLEGYDPLRNRLEKMQSKSLVMITTWTDEHQKITYGQWAGLRKYGTMPDVTKATLLFQSGRAKVYKQ